MRSVKLVTVGDSGVGKTSMLIAYTTNSFPREYIPTVFDDYSANIMVDGRVLNISLWDTAGGDEYDRLRPLAYPQTDFLFVCFSVGSLDSFQHIRSKWIPELSHHCFGVAKLLVGTKSDLRRKLVAEPHDGAGGASDERYETVPEEEIAILAKEMGAIDHCEVSSLEQVGLKDMFEMSYRFLLNPRDKQKKRTCTLF